jgi:GntR family transcriptional regulator, transcriptional repressor for pyruvate dehydrogenase complex
VSHADGAGRRVTDPGGVRPAFGPLDVDRPTVSNLVAKRLLEHLLSGEVAVGDRLPPERELAAALGVGRSAVREATQALGLLGVLEVRQGAGTFVRGTTSDLLPRVLEWGLLLGDRGVRDLVETRTAIEVAIAGLAATRAEPQDLADLDALVRRMRSEVDRGPEAMVELGLAFHLRLAEAARNDVLAGLLRSLGELLRVWARQLRASGSGQEGMQLRIDQHEAIVGACRAADAQAAEDAMRRHLSSSLARLDHVLEG